MCIYHFCFHPLISVIEAMHIYPMYVVPRTYVRTYNHYMIEIDDTYVRTYNHYTIEIDDTYVRTSVHTCMWTLL